LRKGKIFTFDLGGAQIFSVVLETLLVILGILSSLFGCKIHDNMKNIRSPDSVASTKELFQSTWVADEDACLRKETDLQMKLIGTWNQIAASGRQFGAKLPYYHGRK